MRNSSFSILLFGLIVLAMTASVGLDMLLDPGNGGRVAEAEAPDPDMTEEDRLLSDLEAVLAKSVAVYQGILDSGGLSPHATGELQKIKEAHKGDLLMVRGFTDSRSSLKPRDMAPDGDMLVSAVAMEEGISAKCLEALQPRAKGVSGNTRGLVRLVNGNSQWALEGLRDILMNPSATSATR